MALTPKVRDSPPRGPPGEAEKRPGRRKTPPTAGKRTPPTGAAKGASIAFVTHECACRGDAPDPYAACGRKVSSPEAAGADERRGGGGSAMRQEPSTRTERDRAERQDPTGGTENAKKDEKNCFVNVRMTVEERSRLEGMAKEAGLTRSDFVRACVSGKEIRQRQGAEIGQLYTEINRIGNNINQIARSVNAGIADAKDAREALFLLRRVYELMEAVADK